MTDAAGLPGHEVVRRMFAAYRAGDRAAAEVLLSAGLRFTSPQDDHIDRTTYLERCFPTAARFRTQRILATSTVGEQVFVLYEYELADTGDRFRNTEVITVRGGQISEIQVFFGGRCAR
jgi:ketosteroid isomerase-like protein